LSWMPARLTTTAAQLPVGGAQLAYKPRSPIRGAAFDTGGEPLPAYAYPPPRRTRWERDWQSPGAMGNALQAAESLDASPKPIEISLNAGYVLVIPVASERLNRGGLARECDPQVAGELPLVCSRRVHRPKFQRTVGHTRPGQLRPGRCATPEPTAGQSATLPDGRCRGAPKSRIWGFERRCARDRSRCRRARRRVCR